MVPSIGEPREAPVTAIVARVVATVGRRVSVLPQLRKQCYVEEIHWGPHAAQHFAHDGGSRWLARRVSGPRQGLLLPLTVPLALVPIFAPVLPKISVTWDIF